MSELRNWWIAFTVALVAALGFSGYEIRQEPEGEKVHGMSEPGGEKIHGQSEPNG